MNFILLSGGSGKRLWPLSNDIRSKQFIKIFKNEKGMYESMLQRVYKQIKKADPEAAVTIATSKTQVSAIHNQLGGNVGHLDADGPQTDDAQGLSADLATGELLLGLLSGLAHVLVVGVGAHPLHTADDVAGGQQHTREHQLLHGVGVGSRRVEHGDASLGKRIEGDVVHPSTRAGHGLALCGNVHGVHIGGAHQNGVGLFHVISKLVAVGEQVEADRRDIVQAVNLVHGVLLLAISAEPGSNTTRSIPRNRARPAPPPHRRVKCARGWRLRDRRSAGRPPVGRGRRAG